jgi:hypothetical protein
VTSCLGGGAGKVKRIVGDRLDRNHYGARPERGRIAPGERPDRTRREAGSHPERLVDIELNRGFYIVAAGDVFRLNYGVYLF